MNETMKTILTRRSVRKFSDKAIPDEILKDIADAAMHAPSGRCKKTWQFTVVSNKVLIQKLIDAVRKVTGRDNYDMFNPVAIVIPSNSRDNVFGREDNACALENIFLAAKSYEIGSVWINQLNNNCDTFEVRAVLDELEIPENHIVYGIAALGYPAQDYSPIPYREIGEVKFFK